MKEYAIYQGDELLCIGTAKECAEKLNVTTKYIQWLTMPCAKDRIAKSKDPEKCIIGIRLDDEEVEEDLTCEAFSDYLKFMRQSVQMTRKQLADAIGFNFDTVARWENGKRLPSKINTIIEAVRNEVKLRIKYKSV
ncbi:helix-turn-helix transcriptional regulator [Metabacillus fastidiosus]|uniref:helix-turn-helix domain-containing protein n=1 Tax=Metabacillus fastidiosus TaxID=1458 RepID=UPI002E1ECD37|nr:helix-turn-helix transcriptional regulator [Metabacillus fastidiosus]